MTDRPGGPPRATRRITSAQLEAAQAYQRDHGGGLGSALVRLGIVAADEDRALRDPQYGAPSIDLSQCRIADAVLGLLPADIARKHQVVPLGRSATTLTVAMADPRDIAAMDDIRFRTGYAVEPVVASGAAVRAALARYYGDGDADAGLASAPSLDRTAREIAALPAGSPDDGDTFNDRDEVDVFVQDPPAGQAPVVRLVNAILASAVQRGASDIHVEPYEAAFRVRFRIDGVLHQVMTPPIRLRDAITSRLKVMAKLDIAERRAPQDGRLRMRVHDGGAAAAIDARVSCLPTLFGEKVVLRLLDRAHLRLDLAALGFEGAARRRFEAAIRRPWGLVLVTGPTGSGKTSTLYASVARLNTPATNIVTAEDPVEFNLDGVNQVPIRERTGLGFAAALRAFLRQDPDIMLVGEIRDVETAEIAVKAALTGHLVLSTLHTNDAPSAVSRLLNMGIDPFLVAGSLTLVCAQRLVRRVCGACAGPQPMGRSALIDLGFSEAEAARVVPQAGRGCDACHGTGCRGRVGLYEVMEVTPAVRDAILAGAPASTLQRIARADGMRSLRQSGLRRIAEGVTSVDEVTRETV